MNRVFLTLTVVIMFWGLAQTSNAQPETVEHIRLASGRSYNLYVPENLVENAPVYVHLHGLTGNGFAAQMALTQFTQANLAINAQADEAGFIVVYPHGTMIADNVLQLSWNAGTCCSTAFENDIDDVSFLSEVIEDVLRTQSVNEDQIYIGGHSNGGLLAFTYACQEAERVAGLITISAVKTVENCDLNSENSWLHIHGYHDTAVPILGGLVTESGYQLPSFTNTFVAMVELGVPLELHLLEGAGHSIENLNDALSLENESVSSLIASFIRRNQTP